MTNSNQTPANIRHMLRTVEGQYLDLSPLKAFDLACAMLSAYETLPDVPEFVNQHERLVYAALNNGAIMGWVRDGKKIGAIKELRALTNCGLREAKDAIEDGRVGNFPNW